MEIDKQEIQEFVGGMTTIEVCAELFKRKNFSFIVEGVNKEGENVTHEKQREAFEILTCGLYEEFYYGGGAGSGKSWVGNVWIMFMCICYPGIRCFIARNELSDIVDSVLVTFKKVAKEYGFTDFKFNAQKHFIEFGNGSHINFIEIKYKPSDKMFEDVGSTEYTIGWIEEVGEIHPTGATVIGSRVGRFMNDEYGINEMVFYTGNPKKNWTKTQFYDKDKNGTLEAYKRFLACLVVENPFIEKSYIKKLKRLADKDKSLYERLFKGNWDYEDNPNALCEYEMIEAIWENDHLTEGRKYITADIARYGSDKAVIVVWSGWIVIDMLVFDISKTTDIENSIMLLRRKYRIPKNRCLADEDGVGGGVVDGSGIVGYTNNARALKQKGKDENYQNLKTQCVYLFSDKINEGEFWVNLELSASNKEDIMKELDQMQSANKNDRKLSIKNKDDIKQDIGRSPDYLDAFMMRVYFDLKPIKRRGLSSVPRSGV